MLIMTQKEYERRVKAALDKRMEEEVKFASKFARMEDDMRRLHRELCDMESRLRKMMDAELSALRRDENHTVCGEALRE